MSEAKQAVYDRLDEWGIPYRRIDHEAVSTIEECADISERLGAMICKNYFLTTKSRRVYAVCVVRPNARFKTADISRQAGTPRLTFADEESMAAMLHTFPGAVSPMGLIFPEAREVRLLMDAELRNAPELAFHPCDNTSSLAMSAGDFFGRFLPAAGHEPEFVNVHDFDENAR